jgi:ADP-ribosylglycohydrolase
MLAANLGDNADTTAVVTGQLAGALSRMCVVGLASNVYVQ